MACGTCGAVGHNRRTCTSKSKNVEAAGSSKKIEKPHSVVTPTNTRSFSSQTSTPVNDVKDAILSGRDIKANVLTLHEVLHDIKESTNTKGKSKAKVSIKKFEEVVSSSTSTKQHPKAKPAVCNSGTQETLDNRKTKHPVQGENWLNTDAQTRLRQGPSKEDGAGHIYIYIISNPSCEADKNCYKIGLSKDLPARRIYAQEKANKQKYDAVFSAETPYRYLTETVIHRQLKSQRTPKSDGDGRTEWFTGNRDEFIDTVKKVIREVNGLYSEV